MLNRKAVFSFWKKTGRDKRGGKDEEIIEVI